MVCTFGQNGNDSLCRSTTPSALVDTGEGIFLFALSPPQIQANLQRQPPPSARVHFSVDREITMNLKKSVLLCLFPNG